MADREFVVVTSIGTDRPGIVEALSGWILELGGNIEDSQMALLGGEFATLMLVSGEGGFLGRVESGRQGFESGNNLAVFTRTVQNPTATTADGVHYHVTAKSLDHPGIVHQVAQVLRRSGVNIVAAKTRTTPAPFSSSPVFEFDLTVSVPTAVPIESVQKELQELATQEDMEITWSAGVK